MLSSALTALGDHLDSRFLTAFWLPAFVATLGSLSILASVVGKEQLGDWVTGFDSVEQSWAVAILLLATTMLSFVLRALMRPIGEIFAGEIMPRVMARWAIQGQLSAKHAAARVFSVEQDPTHSAVQAREGALARAFPLDEGAIRPTRLGNVLAAASDHPQLAYAMNGRLWWPRLTPLLPAGYQGRLAGAVSPMMALLNLSVVFCMLGVVAVVVLGLLSSQWAAALTWLVLGALLAWLCYQAAVSQAAELSRMLRVAFDLYRHEILKLWGLVPPADLAAERALWQRLTNDVLGLPRLELTGAPGDNAAQQPAPIHHPAAGATEGVE